MMHMCETVTSVSLTAKILYGEKLTIRSYGDARSNRFCIWV